MIKMTPVEYLLVDSNDSISYTNVMYVHFLFKKRGLCNLRKCIISRGQQSRLILKYSHIHKCQLTTHSTKT